LVEPIEVKRRLAAIFAADVEGYSRLMGADEVATLDALTSRREILDRNCQDGGLAQQVSTRRDPLANPSCSSS
jgi:class 3 adenylate cyclase